MSIADKMLAAVGCGVTTGHGDSCTKGWECGACRKLRDFAAEVRYIENEMNRVAAFLNPNWSNDMEWSDEIIIAIQNYEQPLPVAPNLPSDEQLDAIYGHATKHPFVGFVSDKGEQTEIILDGRGTMEQWRGLLAVVCARG